MCQGRPGSRNSSEPSRLLLPNGTGADNNTTQSYEIYTTPATRPLSTSKSSSSSFNSSSSFSSADQLHKNDVVLDVAATACSCELCGSAASVYCLADDAYLCSKCDGWVHGANFLANRHVRCVLCRTCHRFTSRFVVGLMTTRREVKANSKVVKGRIHFCEGNETTDCLSSRELKRPFSFF